MPTVSTKKALAFAMIALLLQGCSLAARDGPTASRITATDYSGIDRPIYRVVSITRSLATKVQDYYAVKTAHGFSTLPPPADIGKIGPGDVLRISIWEANAKSENLFSAGANMTVVVGGDGSISVPYAGHFSVEGMVPAGIERKIARRLKGKAYRPQVLVQLLTNVYNTVFIQGQVSAPGRFPLTTGGNKLLDMLALAGGARLAPSETIVSVTRGGATVSTDLYRIMHDPALNIALSPRDSVILSRRTDVFYAFGSVGRVGSMPYGEHTENLLQAMGVIAGLQDRRADPRGVFIFRYTPVPLASSLGLMSKAGAKVAAADDVPVVYHINMENPNSFFIMNTFPVRPSDIIYVSNAPLNDFQKVVDTMLGAAVALNTSLTSATLVKP